MPGPALLFDLDGTLVDSAMGIAVALSVMASERGGHAIRAEQVRPLLSRGASELVSTSLGPLAGDGAADLATFRQHLSRVPADPAMIYPGVVSALIRLADFGMPMAIVTNKPESLARQLLDALDLARFFKVVVGGDTLSAAKPDPAPLRHALAELGHDGAAIMIGDSEIDAAAAAAATIPFVLYIGGYGAAQCADLPVHVRFGSFSALPAMVTELFRVWSCDLVRAPVLNAGHIDASEAVISRG